MDYDRESLDPAELRHRCMEAGHSAFDREDYAAALDSYHRASVADGSAADVWVSLGMTLANLDFPREAWRSYMLALQRDPASADALWYAAEFLGQQEDAPLAHTLLMRYREIETDPQRLADAAALAEEIAELAAEQGLTLDAPVSDAAAALLRGEAAADDEREADSATEAEDQGLSDAELEALALAGERFVAPLTLRLTGFEGLCRGCGLNIPFDAPYCWSCKALHFYE